VTTTINTDTNTAAAATQLITVFKMRKTKLSLIKKIARRASKVSAM
jgi:hypothetical protein